MIQKILLVDDHPLFRRGLKELLEIEESISVIGEATNGQEAIDFVEKVFPDIIVMDITMPTINGIEATKSLVLKYPQIKIIALSMHAGKRFVKGMLGAGAKGYLLKDSAPNEIVSAIKKVGSNQMYISSEVTSIALSKDEYFSAKPILLKTKLYQPQLSKKFVERKDILNFLNNNIKNPLTVVLAPPGYGKSITISQWVSQIGCAYSWISIDKDLDNFNVFVKYLEKAIVSNYSASLKKFHKLINDQKKQPINILAYTFINEIEEIKKQIVLVLDNFHIIKNAEMLEFIGELIKYCPKNLHLVISSRENLQYKINYLRLEEKVNEVELDKLCFSDFEIKKYVQLNTNLELNIDWINKLQHVTEGWALGLRFMVKSLQETNYQKDGTINIKEIAYLFDDYFSNEILSKLDHNFVESLEIAAALTSFNEGILNEIFVKNKCFTNGGAFLEKLKKSNLFIRNLEEKNHWFQFHPLFKKVLLKQLKNRIDTNLLNEFHKTAYQYFAENGALNEAIKNALLISDNEIISEIIIENQFDLLDKELWVSIKNVVEVIPNYVLEKHMELELFTCFFYDYCGEFKPKVVEIISKLALKIASLDVKNKDNFAVLCSYFLLKAKQQEIDFDIENSLLNIEKALSYVPVENQYLKVKCLQIKSRCLQKQESTEKGIRILFESTKNLFTFNIAYQSRLSLAFCSIYFYEGNLEMVLAHAKDALRIALKENLRETINESYYVLCLVYYLRNQINETEKYLNLIFKQPHYTRATTLVYATIIKCLIKETNNDFEKSWQVITLLEKNLKIKEGSELYNIVKAYKKDLTIKNKQQEEGSQLNFKQNRILFCANMSPYFMGTSKIKMLINNRSLKEAKSEITALKLFAKKHHNKFMLLISSIFEAYLYGKIGDKKKGVYCLTEALAISEQGEYIVHYHGFGNTITDFMRFLNEDLEKNQYIYKLFNSFNAKNLVNIKNNNELTFNVADRLSVRELEIVKYVAKGMRNKEIAKELSVSDYTIKKHLYNTYQKLNIKNRIALIQKFEKTDFLNN